MPENNNGNRNGTRPNQYKKDWSYAARQLEKGANPQDVEKNIATFRKDHTNPEQYAKTTVEKVLHYLEVQEQLKAEVPGQELPQPDAKALDETQCRLADLEFARQQFDNRMEAPVVEALLKERGHSPEEARQVAFDAKAQLNAERDLDYAVRARERGETNDKILPEIAKYRENDVPDPQAYAKAVLQQADNARNLEKFIPVKPMVTAELEIAQRQYGRDLTHAVEQLELRPSSEVQQAIQERRPEKALESPSNRIYGQPDHSYAIAVVQQAEKIRAIAGGDTERLQTIAVAQKEFGRHLREAYESRQAGRSRTDAITHLSEGSTSKESYARAVVNEADSARERAREISIRPELARQALEQTTQRIQPDKTKEMVGAER